MRRVDGRALTATQTKFFKKTDAARIRKMEKQLLIKSLGAACKELPSTKSHGVWLLWRTPTSCHYGGQITPFLRKHITRCPNLLTCPLSPQPSSASTLWNCGETGKLNSTNMYLKPSVFRNFVGTSGDPTVNQTWFLELTTEGGEQKSKQKE